MMVKKNAEGLKFILKLDMAADDTEKLVLLAKQAVDESHDKRTFCERKNQDLRVNPTSINLGSAIGTGHAMLNNNLSTNDKLYMIMNKYIKLVTEKNPKLTKEKALECFCEDFARKFPQEYGIKRENVNNKTFNPMLLRRQREMM